ncbi:MAG: CHC2 zinc finger domain-containing protein [Isosphaeraceae bacterium]
MPGIHFAEARARITLAEVLTVLGFVPCESSGDQVRGPCPVHHSASPSSRSFSANLKRHIYRCFKCGSCGNQLDLYASATGLSLFEATITLCEQLHREVPWMLHELGTPIATPRRHGADAWKTGVKRITPQPLRWSPLDRKSGTLSNRYRHFGSPSQS